MPPIRGKRPGLAGFLSGMFNTYTRRALQNRARPRPVHPGTRTGEEFRERTRRTVEREGKRFVGRALPARAGSRGPAPFEARIEINEEGVLHEERIPRERINEIRFALAQHGFEKVLPGIEEHHPLLAGVLSNPEVLESFMRSIRNEQIRYKLREELARQKTPYGKANVLLTFIERFAH
ncbi:MAG: hypothetical protein HY393_00025 [Candidatus Diapherotrites archaeon]|nr:hypothetical protein [Candidatus Diapherotrites archaeon]